MTIDEAIVAAVVKATRKKKTTTDLGAKYDALLVAADTLQKEWQTKDDWSSLRQLVSIGHVTATDTFDLDDTIRKISQQEGDVVYITRTNGSQSTYTVVPAQRLRDYPAGVAQVGRTIKFGTAFTSSSADFAGTITVPASVYVDDITLGTQETQVDDPMWLVYSLAAEWARNDKTRPQLEEPFLTDAAGVLDQMKRDNGSQLEEVANELDMTVLGGTWV